MVPESRFVAHPPLHVITTAGHDDRTYVAVHGLGGSARNWEAIAGGLGGTVVAVDLPGFGVSAPRPGDQIDVQVEAVHQLLELLDRPVTLIGNSMGGLVSAIVASEDDGRVERLVLIAPASPLPPLTKPADPAVVARLIVQSLPGVGVALTRRLADRFTPSQLVHSTFDLVAAEKGRISPAIIESAIENATLRRSMPWSASTFARSAAGVRRRLLRRRRFEEMIAAITAPTLLIWGDEDRLVSPASMFWMSALASGWTTVEMTGIGHVPMLEAPAATLDAITRWETLDSEGRAYADGPGLETPSAGAAGR